MKITYTCKKFPLSETVKEYAEKKLSKLDRYFKDEPETHVVVTLDKRRSVVEVTVRDSGGLIFRAWSQVEDGDIGGAIVASASAIERQIRKYKKRLRRNLRTELVESDFPTEFEVQEEEDFNIVRTKYFRMKPMTPEEAILQMNLLGHRFFMFRDVDDGRICVVYKRDLEDYGMICADEDE